jgi:uncharacterized protein YigE (DUF2233 family)
MSRIFLLISLLLLASIFLLARKKQGINSEDILSYTIDSHRKTVKLYWKDDKEKRFGSIQNLRSWLTNKNQKLIFAMNGGMYKPNHTPVGLYIENGKKLSPVDTAEGIGNFYLKPNGFFGITHNGAAVISNTDHFVANNNWEIATQSGPMLVIEGRIHPAFTIGSANKTIRNGVGILPNGNIVFALSKKEISFYDFAHYFKQLGCQNALYLDGFVSRAYLPEKNWIQTDGDFGVMIGVVEKN